MTELETDIEKARELALAEYVERELAPFEAEMKQQREMWDTIDGYYDKAETLISEMLAFCMVQNGLQHLITFVLAITPVEEYNGSDQVITVDEFSLASMAIRDLIKELIEETLGNLFANNPNSTLRPLNIPFSQLQAINISTDRNRPILIGIDNNLAKVTEGSATQTDQQIFVLTLEQMREHARRVDQEFSGLSADFAEAIQRYTLLPLEEKREAVTSMKEFFGGLRQIITDGLQEIEERCQLVLISAQLPNKDNSAS